ncbi:MAG: SDR family NAD(P)-dependent oxidoreductase [Dermatophilaceae bacterium]
MDTTTAPVAPFPSSEPTDLLGNVVVTGAGRGLGVAVVQAALDRGAATVHATARDPRSLARWDDDPRVVAHRLDLTDPASIRAVAAATGPVTLLVNNAGTAEFGALLDADPAAVGRELATNTTGTLDVVRAFVPGMPQGSAVVSVLSLLSLAATPGMGGYSMSKAAAHSMVQAIRPPLRERGIAVVGVYPGAIDTEMLAGVEMAKASPRSVAEALLDGVLAGEEDVFPDPMAAQLAGTWRSDPKAFERAFAAL